MAEVTLSVQQIDKAGAAPTFTAVDDVDTYKFRNSARALLYFKNTGGSPAVVTLDTPGTVAGLAIANPTATVPAGGEQVVAMVPTSAFNDSGGNASFTQNQATGVTVAVLEVD